MQKSNILININNFGNLTFHYDVIVEPCIFHIIKTLNLYNFLTSSYFCMRFSQLMSGDICFQVLIFFLSSPRNTINLNLLVVSGDTVPVHLYFDLSIC